MGLNYNSLVNYYTTVFALVQHHKYSLAEIEEMLPFERDIYLSLLVAFLEKQKNELENM